jgi:hypothetical protein
MNDVGSNINPGPQLVIEDQTSVRKHAPKMQDVVSGIVPSAALRCVRFNLLQLDRTN